MIFPIIGFVWGVSLVGVSFYFYRKGYADAVDDIVAMTEMIKGVFMNFKLKKNKAKPQLEKVTC